MQWILSSPKGLTEHIHSIILTIVVWFIWKSRIAARFEGVRMNANSIILQVQQFLQLVGRFSSVQSVQLEGDFTLDIATFFKIQPARKKCVMVIK